MQVEPEDWNMSKSKNKGNKPDQNNKQSSEETKVKVDKEVEEMVSEETAEESVEETTESDLEEEDVIEKEEIIEDKPSNQNIISNNYNSSIFETIDPFEPMPLFMDRSDDDTSILDKNISIEEIEDSKEELEKVKLEIQKEKISNIEENTIENDMPDAFWITQSDDTDKVNNEEGVLSFDEQINVLLANEENTKIKKLVSNAKKASSNDTSAPTIKIGDTSNIDFTLSNGNYVLENTPVYPTSGATNGYGNVVLQNNGTTITSGTAQTITADTTFTTSATDVTDPTVTISRTDYNTFSWTASDNVGITGYAVTNSSTAPTSWTTSGTLTSGTKDVSTTAKETWYVWVKDAAGHTKSASITNYKVTLTTPSILL